jgi:hypothetical protein
VIIIVNKSMIVHKNIEKREITAPVLIPNTPDCDFDKGEKLLSIQEIEDFSHKYMEKYRIRDKEHDFLVRKLNKKNMQNIFY